MFRLEMVRFQLRMEVPMAVKILIKRHFKENTTRQASDMIKNFRKDARSGRVTIHDLKRKDGRWHITKYRIRESDNLWNIARRFGINHHLIIGYNNIKDPKRLIRALVIQSQPTGSGSAYRIPKKEKLNSLLKLPTPFLIRLNSLCPLKAAHIPLKSLETHFLLKKEK